MSATHDNSEQLECGLTAFAGVEVRPGQIPGLRRKPHDHVPLPTGLLKYADDQAVAAVAAVFAAIHDHGLSGTDFTNWGVAAAPRFLGRETCTIFLERFRRQGALAVSPLLAVYQSLHAVSGPISLALRIHGPNMGVGGGYGCFAQAMMTGLAMRAEHQLPGLWMVFTEWDPEPVPDDQGKFKKDAAVCRAVALALKPVPAGWQGLRLRLVPDLDGLGISGHEVKRLATEPTLAGLAAFLHASAPGAPSVDADRSWQCPLSWNARLELTTRCHDLAAEPSSRYPPLAA